MNLSNRCEPPSNTFEKAILDARNREAYYMSFFEINKKTAFLFTHTIVRKIL